MNMANSKKRIYLSHESIEQRVAQLAHDIERNFAGEDVVLVGVLKGAYVFLADLSRRICIPHIIDFVRLASYGEGTVSSGTVKITKDIETPLKNKCVIIVEDIVDAGHSLEFLKDHLAKKHPRSISICVLLDKKARREVDIEVDYTGFIIDDLFVVGYGLDWNEQYRYLPDIYAVEQ